MRLIIILCVLLSGCAVQKSSATYTVKGTTHNEDVRMNFEAKYTQSF